MSSEKITWLNSLISLVQITVCRPVHFHNASIKGSFISWISFIAMLSGLHLPCVVMERKSLFCSIVPPPSPRCCPTGNRLYSGLAAVSTRIAVGHNLPLALLHTYSLGLLQALELAVPAARTAFWSGVCPFSTCAEGQEAPRCPQAALVAVSGMRKR